MILHITIITALFILGFFTLNHIQKTTLIKTKYTRKVAHVVSALGAYFVSPVMLQYEFLITASLFIVFFTLSKRFNWLPSIHNTARTSYGEILFPLGIFVIASQFYWPNPLFLCGLLLLALPDTFAAIIGTLANPTRKTFLGSFTYFVISMLILPFFFPIGESITYALILTLIEKLSSYGTDNVTIPLAYVFLVSII